jgi:predicted aconitase with swiveling domain
MLYEMASREVAPKAILFNSVNTILAQGAALAEMTMVDRFEDGDVTKLIKTGDLLIVCPDEGKVIFAH